MNRNFQQNIFLLSTPEQRFNGFFYPKYNVLITNYKSTSGFRKIVARDGRLTPQLSIVQGFDPVYNLAFYRLSYPFNSKYNPEKFYLPNVGQHVRFFVMTVSSGMKSFNAVVIKFNEQNNIPFFHLRSDFNSPASVGGFVTDTEYRPLGIIVDQVYDRMEVIPFKHIIESILDITDFPKYAFRCPFCGEILTNETVSLGKCSYCGQLLPQDLYQEPEYIATKDQNKIESIISQLNYDPFLARLDKNYWLLNKENLLFFIYHDDESHSIVVYTILMQIPERLDHEQKQKLYNFLLQQNARLKWLTMSLHQNNLILSTTYLSLSTVSVSALLEPIGQLFAQAMQLKHQAEQFIKP